MKNRRSNLGDSVRNMRSGRLNFSGSESQSFRARIERRPEIMVSTKKQKESIKIDFRPIKSIFYLLLFFALIYFLFISSIFKIKNIEIDGIKSVEITDYVNLTLLNKNIILLRPGNYLNELSAKFPILEQAKIVRGLPATIKITALERKQVLIWCSTSCFEVDNSGFAYEHIQKPADKIALIDNKMIPIELGDQVATADFINFYLNAIDQINGLGLSVTEADIDETTFKVSFKTSENWSVIMDSSASLKNQISALKQVIDKNRADIHEYVDVRVEGSAYIK